MLSLFYLCKNMYHRYDDLNYKYILLILIKYTGIGLPIYCETLKYFKKIALTFKNKNLYLIWHPDFKK